MLTPLVPALLLALAPGAVREPAPVEVELTLALEPEPAVELAVAAPGSPEGTTRFSVASAWGGVSAGGEDLEPLEALGRDGRALELERPEPHLWLVHHDPDEPLVLRYRIPANGHQSVADPDVSRRPIVTGALFHAYGHLALLFPEHLQGDLPRTLRFRWRGFDDAGWEVACSFGLPEEGALEVLTTLWKAQSAVYLAGDLRVHSLDAAGGPLAVAVAGDRWRFADEQLVELVGRVVEAERSFFDEGRQDFYLVSLIPAGPPADERSHDMGGTALTRSFSLIMAPNASLEGEAGLAMARLLAHEYFHEWNGHVIGLGEPEELGYWFSEGFTDFYARRMLARAGLLDPAGYARSVDQALRGYLTSPVREAPGQRVLADYWNDRDVQRLPYQRGDLIAMLLDRELRAASGGERGLDELMRALVAEARAGDLRVDTEDLLERFAAAGAGALVGVVREALDGGCPLPIPEDLFAPCLVMSTVEEPLFEVGFDLDRSLAERVVRGVVPGSRAHAAGLRDGQPLRGLSVHRGRTDLPVELVVEEDGRERRIQYEPLGERIALPHFEPAPGADCSSL